MHVEPARQFNAASGQLPLSVKVRACANRFEGAGDLRVASLEEALALISIASETMDLASPAVIRTVHHRNPDVFRILEADRGPPTLIAYLPLNDVGLGHLLNGMFDGRAPDPALIAPDVETTKAIYIWLIWAPGRLARAIPSLLRLVDELSSVNCPIFSRAVNAHAKKLNASVGFEVATQVYEHAPDWLLVIQAKRSPPKIDVQIVRSFDDMAQIFAVRAATYMAEQFCLFSEEFDGNDFCATQFVGRVDGDAAGCIRLRYFRDFVKVERLAVRREYRRSKLAYRLVRTALDHAKAKGFCEFYGHSREDLLRFWQVFGFKPIPERPEFRFAGIDYREIMLSLPTDTPVIGVGSQPMHTIRPEGAWDSPGPLELSNIRPPLRSEAPTIRRLGRHADGRRG